jgi:hypothetical protein
MKRGKPAEKTDQERRATIQRLVWDKGVSYSDAARIMGVTDGYCRTVARSKECECGNPIKRGSTTCERCGELESVASDFLRDSCGIKEADLPSTFFGRMNIHRACEQFEEDRGLLVDRSKFIEWADALEQYAIPTEDNQ